MPRRPRITPEKQQEILRLREEGWGYKRIAKATGVSKACIEDYVKPGAREYRSQKAKERYLKIKQNPKKLQRLRERNHENYINRLIRSVMQENA
ncbi:hypothetical protein PP744_gp070 [Rhizobium phage RHph_N38]|uniref:Resolvase HTH domain-containing protein n=1 Tax=Rhizobium phage RHph_N38 TaxID=2509750 RepID=A0A7S5UUP6_9CAUD|nr:hypothetical protein PP744_gp070 [Rhizobium phage RHph_N38]QIG70533.1 hypothetical protein EVB89_070 [Rhizobium phage RHph_N38]